MHQGVLLALIKEVQILPAGLEAPFDQIPRPHPPAHAQVFLAIALDMRASERVDIVAGRSPLLGVIETQRRALRVLRINPNIRDVQMKGFRLPQAAAMQQDGDQDVLEAQLFAQRLVLLAARGKTSEQQIPDAIRREEFYFTRERCRRLPLNGDDATDLGTGLIVGTIARVAKQRIGVALVETSPEGDLLADRCIAPRIDPARPMAIFQPVRECCDRSKEIPGARDGLGLPKQFGWIVAVQIERAPNQGLREFGEDFGLFSPLSLGAFAVRKSTSNPTALAVSRCHDRDRARPMSMKYSISVTTGLGETGDWSR